MGIGHGLTAAAAQVRRRYGGTDRAAEYARLLRLARDAGYELVTLREFAARTAQPGSPRDRLVALRHDVDIADVAGNRAFHELELAAGARSTFYFRWSTAPHHRALIKRLLADGFEVGYHYEETATIAKRRTLASREEVEAHRDEIADLMRHRCAEFRRRWNPDLASAASHGDWSNRLLGIPNHELVDARLLAECGLAFEAYGEQILGRADVYVSDVAAPPFHLDARLRARRRGARRTALDLHADPRAPLARQPPGRAAGRSAARRRRGCPCVCAAASAGPAAGPMPAAGPDGLARRRCHGSPRPPPGRRHCRRRPPSSSAAGSSPGWPRASWSWSSAP